MTIYNSSLVRRLRMAIYIGNQYKNFTPIYYVNF